jgi:isoleucyl-tRNA synthetase
MDQLYRDLVGPTQENNAISVHLEDFPVADATKIDIALEQRMQKAQTISSLVLSIRQKEKIKVRQPLNKVMIPVLDQNQRAEIESVADLIRTEVNVKEIQLLDDASDILVKRIKPNFKTLGPKYGSDMKAIAASVAQFSQSDIQKIEREGQFLLKLNTKSVILELQDVEITSQDIEGWLVASSGSLTVALDITIDEGLRSEGIARELVNRIQNLRKDSGLEVTDKIDITILKDSIVEEAVNRNLDYIKTETLTADLKFTDNLETGTEIAFEDIKTKLHIKKH